MKSKRSTQAANGKEEKQVEKKKKKKQNQRELRKNQTAMKREPEIMVVESSSVDSEEKRDEEQQEEEEEEEAKSSNNSNQNSDLAPKDEEEEEEEEEEATKEENGVKRRKTLSNGVTVSGSFPTHRLKRMIRSEGDFRTTGEAICLINKATEKFLETLAEDAYTCCVKDRKKTVNYKHLSSVVGKTKRYDFLSDFVPEKARAEDALEEWKSAAT